MALALAAGASDKKALDIVIISMKKMSSVCDYFVIASGTSTTHVRALSDNIIKTAKEKGHSLLHKEGEREASWILLDFGAVVCHLFLEKTRAFYDLEGLWREKPKESKKLKVKSKNKKYAARRNRKKTKSNHRAVGK